MDFNVLSEQVRTQVVIPFSNGLLIMLKSIGSLFLILFHSFTALFK